jgi:hypothetical protein
MNAIEHSQHAHMRAAIIVFIATVVLAAPLGVALSVSYRLLFVLEAWILGAHYDVDQREFYQPARILAAIAWTYVICAVPVIAASAALAWRTWARGGFGYLYAAATAGVTMALYMATAAYVFRQERVRIVTADTAFDGILYAVLVSILSTAMLRRAGILKRH